MSWQQLQITAKQNNAEAISELLFDLGAVSVTFLDAADQPIYEPKLETTPLWQQTQVIGLFTLEVDLALILQLLNTTFADDKIQCEISEVADQDWIRLTQAQVQPTRFGQRLWVYPTWHEIPNTDITAIILDPGLAFGTGSHPTTALCLEWLDANVKPGWQVIDYGCGSGILGIAALALGAKQVWAIDNDPQALEATRQNAEKNHITVEQLITATPDNPPYWQADLIIANILAGPLMELAPHFTQLVKPGGCLVLSGILREQVADVAATYTKQFRFSPPKYLEEWGLLAGIHTL